MPRSNAPYYIMQGSQGLGRGIRDAGNSIAGLITDRKERREKEKESKEMMEGFKMFYENSPELQKMMPVQDFDDLSPNMVRGMTQAMTAKAAMMDNLFKPHFETDAEGNRIFMQAPRSGFPAQGRRSVDAGSGPQMSEDGRFYLNPEEGEWKPMPSSNNSIADQLMQKDEVERLIKKRNVVLQAIDTQQEEIADKGRFWGPDKLEVGTDKQIKLDELQKELAGIEKEMQTFSGSRKTGKPRIGQNVDGYIFLGGDPSDQNNWDKE